MNEQQLNNGGESATVETVQSNMSPVTLNQDSSQQVSIKLKRSISVFTIIFSILFFVIGGVYTYVYYNPQSKLASLFPYGLVKGEALKDTPKVSIESSLPEVDVATTTDSMLATSTESDKVASGTTVTTAKTISASQNKKSEPLQVSHKKVYSNLKINYVTTYRKSIPVDQYGNTHEYFINISGNSLLYEEGVWAKLEFTCQDGIQVFSAPFYKKSSEDDNICQKNEISFGMPSNKDDSFSFFIVTSQEVTAKNIPVKITVTSFDQRSKVSIKTSISLSSPDGSSITDTLSVVEKEAGYFYTPRVGGFYTLMPNVVSLTESEFNQIEELKKDEVFIVPKLFGFKIGTVFIIDQVGLKVLGVKDISKDSVQITVTGSVEPEELFKEFKIP